MAKMIKFKPLWSDSLGAKSYSVYLEVGDKRIIVDPGVAAMQPSYPADRKLKLKWRDEAYQVISEYLSKSEYVIITHYHHDHYLWRESDIEKYYGKKLLIKNPNMYINDSQWRRAQEFIQLLISMILDKDIHEYLSDVEEEEFPDLTYELREALALDLGDYNKRRRELLEAGRKWFLKRVEKWKQNKWITDSIKSDKILISFIDGKHLVIDDLRIEFTKPLYHGIEYSRVGWVIAFKIEHLRSKIIYTSDVQGPTIEDYATWIINEDPEVLILDGPPTYLIPYSMNLINFRRTVNNLIRIIRSTKKLKLIIYDHHLTREYRYRERVKDVYAEGKERGVEVLTVAEYLGLDPAFKQIGKM